MYVCANKQKIPYAKNGCDINNDGFKDCGDGTDENLKGEFLQLIRYNGY